MDTRRKMLVSKPNAHSAVHVLCCNVNDGTVWSGGGDGVVIRWEYKIETVKGGKIRVGEHGSLVEDTGSRGNSSAILPNDVKRQSSGSGSLSPRQGSWGKPKSPRANLSQANVGVVMGKKSAPPSPRSKPLRPAPRPPSTTAVPKSRDSDNDSRANMKTSANRPNLAKAPSNPQVLVTKAMGREILSFEGESQPSLGNPIVSLSHLGASGRMVSCDTSGLVVVWNSDTSILLSESFDEGSILVCEGESTIFVATESHLNRYALEEDSLSLAHSHRDNEGSFLALTVTSGNTLWACTKTKMKLFSTVTDNELKVIHLHTLSPISTLSVASIHGKETVLAGGTNEVSVWDTRSRSLLTTMHDLKGEVLFNTEIGENLVLSAFKIKDKVTVYALDNNENN